MPVFQIATSMIALAESGRLPDRVIRAGMRNLMRGRLRDLNADALEARGQKVNAWLDELAAGPVAHVPEKANEQHYEVPADFFLASLGRHLKYSCSYWDAETSDLDTAEENALRKSCEHAQLADGQKILELGCGWGSLTLWMAAQYPGSTIHAVSNSHSQRAHIESQARSRGLDNVTVETCDINDFQPSGQFDRVVSVEMFEHVRNHRELMKRISHWLTEDGKLFVHIFCHHRHAYPFEDEGSSDWMARHFFSGGIMPSRDLLLHCQDDLAIEQQYEWDGTHYEKTSNAWLAKMDREAAAVEACFRDAYGADWKTWRQRWRMFYMACAELFGMHDGREWYVSHYRFRRRSS